MILMSQKTNITTSSQVRKAKCFSTHLPLPTMWMGSIASIQKISSLTYDFSDVKVRLIATRHYNYKLLEFIINPLYTNLFCKSPSLRRTKTDKMHAHTITLIMISGLNLQYCSDTSYHNEKLKSLIKHSFNKIKEQAKLKTSVSR